MGLGGILLIGILVSLFMGKGNIAVLFFIGVILLSFCISGYEDEIKTEKNKEIDEYKIKNNIPSNYDITKYNNEDYYLWKTDKSIFLCTSDPKKTYEKIIIDIDNIVSFNLVGDAYTETNVTGGGSSIKGAIIGGVIAGEPGAVVGSRKKIESKTTMVDNRKTILTLNENEQVKNMFFSSTTYEKFQKLIPEKEYSYISSISSINNTTNTKDNTINKLKDLAKLRDDGILTEEEFNEKKQLLLNKIS